MIKSQELKKYHLPDGPGVYFFKKKKNILYVGKATSIKDRVKSYFSSDLIQTRGPLIVDMVFQAEKIDYIETNSVLEALILEANLIKKYQPKYNTKEKDDKSFNYIVITREDFPRVMIERGKDLFQHEGQKKAQVQVLGSPLLLRNKYRPDHSPDQFSDRPYRIEAYDVAHLSGTNNVGVMVVMENGELKKSDYRKFIIRNSKGNDIGALKEVLERRLKHPEWPRADLIVVDGGIAQMNAIKVVLEHNRPRHQDDTPSSTNEGDRSKLIATVIAVTKDDKHKPKAIIGDQDIIKKFKKEILLINNEAHRFAIAFHRRKRNVIL